MKFSPVHVFGHSADSFCAIASTRAAHRATGGRRNRTRKEVAGEIGSFAKQIGGLSVADPWPPPLLERSLRARYSGAWCASQWPCKVN
jgi:hypothetical protein